MSEGTCASGQCKTPAACGATKSPASSQNGKGDAPRNIFTEEFRSNYDSIDWGAHRRKRKTA
ncbi:hypothetical protein QPK87_15910 [Kamptonema cortianum]|nr:hypothetical protein [Oscillatoria laete-virens]MDK3158044.1 hypothetical protein [Kamptonema cortianum]MDL5048189.1 hypothetical protein [Oscillatoria amoena NRMC-F 0135]MDL5053082.1 hypothetical protein [Oscillatoria laete-virens NRMC-F 0139]